MSSVNGVEMSGMIAGNQPSEVSNGGLSTNDAERDAVSAFFRRVGTGFRRWSTDKRRMMRALTNDAQWATKRERYGKSGRKQKPYSQWKAEHPTVVGKAGSGKANE